MPAEYFWRGFDQRMFPSRNHGRIPGQAGISRFRRLHCVSSRTTATLAHKGTNGFFKYDPWQLGLGAKVIGVDSINRHGIGIPKNSEFRQQIEATLRDKYGNPIKITDHTLFKDYDWRINKNAIVTMRPMSDSIIVTYRDVILSNLAEAEQLNRVQKGFKRSDKEKF